MSSVNAEQRIKNLLKLVAQQDASDLHIGVGKYPTLRIDGKLIPLNKEGILTPDETKSIGDAIMSDEIKKKLIDSGQADFSYNLEDKARL